MTAWRAPCRHWPEVMPSWATRPLVDADAVRLMLEDVREEASLEDTRDHRVWITSAVLVARHLERVANNAGELGRPRPVRGHG